MSLYDKASLVMIPSGYKDDKLYSIKPTSGDGDFTFSRDGSGASPATRVNASGLIEKGRENILLQSNTFDTTWVLTAGTSLTSGQSGYDGSSDAWLMTSDGVSGFAPISQNITFSGVSTFSIYAKEGTNQYISLRSLGATDVRAIFNLNTGALHSSSNTIATNITSIGSGWYRLEMVLNASNTSVVIYPNILGTASAGNIYIQDAQLEKGLVATSYIETTTSAVSDGLLGDMPRLDYSGGASCPSLLLEPSRTNVVEYAEYFDIYTKSNATITNNDSLSPEGLQNASSLAGNGATSSHYIYRNSGTAVSGTDYTISFFAKSGSLDYVQLVMGSGAFGVLHQNFDLANGTIGSSSGSVTPFIENYTDGWYRVGITITATASTTITPFIALANSSTMLRLASFATSDDVKIYGLQIEASSYPTSYIPTYGSATARAKDVCDGAGNSSLFNDSEGVLFAEVSFARDKGQSSPFKLDRISLSDGTTNNRILISNTTTANEIQVFIRNSSSNIFNETITLTDITANNKIAVRYESGNYALYINGTEEATGASTNVPSGLNELMFDGPSGNYEFEGKVKQTLYFPTALTDAELAALTA